MSGPFEIIDFYNQGAQVQVAAQTVDMTHTFSGGSESSDSEPKQIGYEPRGNSKLADGAAYDELEHDGQRYLLLKGGYVYDVTVNGEDHVISAEEGHLSLPLPKDAEVEVDEHDERATADEEE